MDALVRALEENRAYTDDLKEFRVDEHDPHAVSVSCCDARVPQGRLFAAQPGEHFTVANIGNSVRARDKEGEPALDASVLYPLLATDPDFAAVVGHTGCGAITAALREVTGREEADERLRSHLDLLVPLVEQGLEEVGTGDSESETVNRLVEYNVHRQVEFLLDAADETPVAGLVCDLHGAFGPETARLHLVNLEGETDRTEFPPELREFEASDSYSTKQ